MSTKAREPLVSVVIPAYNAGRYVGDAVSSVLQQTWRNLECVVVDDGSSDDTYAQVAAVEDARVRCVQQSNRGVSRARNAGVATAHGDYVAFLDADDAWMPEKLERQLRLLSATPGAEAILCGYAVADEQLNPRWVVSSRDPGVTIRRWLLLEGDGPALASTLLLTRSLFDAVGGFREDVPPSEDLHFGVRLARLTEVAMVEAALVLYRTHADQHHRDLEAFESNMRAIYADLLADPAHARVRQRATANLYTRLFFYHLRRGDTAAARRALRHVLASDPPRALLLPTRVAGRRLKERLVGRVRSLPRLPEGTTDRL